MDYLYRKVYLYYIFSVQILFFEKWLYNFKENKSNFYFKKHQNIISSINDDHQIQKEIQKKLDTLEKNLEDLVSQCLTH